MSRYSSPDNVMENFALMLGGSSGIEAQERNEQAKLVSSVEGNTLHLPKPENGDASALASITALGITYGDPIDDLFFVATVPEGWTLKPTDHSMWSNLLDEQGRIRASVFYKGAFYDRKADIRASTRIFATSEYEGGWSEWRERKASITGVVKCDNVIIAQTAPIPFNEEDPYLSSDVAEQAALDWIKANYPDYRLSSAYWDIPRPETVAVIPLTETPK